MRSPRDWQRRYFKLLICISVLSVINLCTCLTTSNDFAGTSTRSVAANVDRNKNIHSPHPIRHHRHYDSNSGAALNRTLQHHHHHHHGNRHYRHSNGGSVVTTRNPSEGMRNLLTSRERDPVWRSHGTTHSPPPHRWHVTSPKPSLYWPHNSVTDSVKVGKGHAPRPSKLPDYESVRSKTLDEIIQEIARVSKRKRKLQTTSSTTETPYTPGFVDEDYEYDDEDGPQGDEADERHDVAGPQQLYPSSKKQDVRHFQSDSASYNPGDLTSLKMQQLGTVDAVRNSMRQYNEAQKKKEEQWKRNLYKSTQEFKCKVPRPQVVPSTDDPSMIFSPRCTVVHRCSDNTSCCPSADKTCVADTSENVYLHFQVYVPFNRSSMMLTKMFLNHTSCHCVDKATDQRTKVPDSITRPDDSCQCPATFRKVFEDHHCRCEFSCTDECTFKREGLESFSMEERGCISRSLCKSPRCIYGKYKIREGRCPKREERFDSVLGSSPTPSQHSID